MKANTKRIAQTVVDKLRRTAFQWWKLVADRMCKLRN